MAKSVSATGKMLISTAVGIVCAMAFASSRQPSEQAAATPVTLSPEAPAATSVSVKSDADFFGVPRSASSADRRIMLKFVSMNNKCTMPNAVTDMKSCDAGDSYQRVLNARGWCSSFDEWDVVYDDNYAWHRCSAERVASISRMRRSEKAYPSMLAFRGVVAPAVLAEASYEADQNCVGVSGLDGRRVLDDHMRDINIRSFPSEPGLWQAAGEWMQRLLAANLAKKKAQGCATFDPSMPLPAQNQGVIVVHRASSDTSESGSERGNLEHLNGKDPSYSRWSASNEPIAERPTRSKSNANDDQANDVHFDRAVEGKISSFAKGSEIH